MARERGQSAQAIVVDVECVSNELQWQEVRFTILPTSLGVPGSTVHTGT
jgi:hypothetical protein